MTLTLSTLTTSDGFQTWFNRTNEIIAALANNAVTANSAVAGSATVGNSFLLGIFGATTIGTDTIRGGNVQSSNTLWIGSNTNLNVAYTFTAGNVVINSTSLVVNSVSVNTSSVKVGNSSVFSLVNSTGASISNLFGNVAVQDSLTANQASVTQSIAVGNSSVNVVITSTAITGPVTQRAGVSTTTTGTSLQTIDSYARATYRAASYEVVVKDNNANNFQLTNLLVLFDGSNALIEEHGVISSNTANVGVFSATSNSTHVLLQFTPVSSNTTVKGARTFIAI